MTRALTLAAGQAHVLLLPQLGGAIGAYRVHGRDVLRATPERAIAERDVRASACYPLIPYSNRIRDARLSFAGRDLALERNFGDHPHAIHGVGWQREWQIVDSADASATLALEHDARGADASSWPWPFAALQGFTLSAHGRRAFLVATLTLINTGDEAFPFGLGWHPFFPRPAGAMLCFAARGVWRNDETGLPLSLAPVPPAWNFAAPRALDALTCDNVFAGWRGDATLALPSQGLGIELTADRACGFLVVYAPADRDFVALEPVTHQTDAFNRAARGDLETGARTLPPGSAFSCTMRIAAEIA